MSSKILFLPGDPDFDFTLSQTLPPGWKHFAHNHPEFSFVARAGDCGLLTPVTQAEAIEYVEGGEYEERIFESGDEDLINQLLFEE